MSFAREVLPVNIEEEMQQSYLDYAMSVIVGRALPDVRDGLKPVHRRVLYAMSVLHNDWNKSYKKSARIVGDVIGKYHPHGDTAVYDTIVRMAQDFSLRYMLVDGQGNFGSVDGDAPAAMRYTEVRMARITHEMINDVDKETVDFVPNYDETETMPDVFPARIPNLLVNGSSGIAVGMATNIPPHHLGETIDATLALIESPDISISELMAHIPGPDFPTAGIINGAAGIHQAYHTGRGRIYVRARTHVETNESTSRQSIVVTELPYQVNKARLIEKIAVLVREKKLEGISGLPDESDKDGMRMVIELKRGESADVVLNNLYQHTAMQSVFGINMVALVNNQPRILNLKQVLEAFVRHRREVVTRRTVYELRKARERAHILEGLAVALAHIDEIIAMIKAAPSPAVAKAALLERLWPAAEVTALLDRADLAIARPLTLQPGLGFIVGDTESHYRLSEVQAQAILDLRLHRLTGLEKDKILQELEGLLEKIRDWMRILEEEPRLLEVVCAELEEVKEQFSDQRRTDIVASQEDLNYEDLIPEEDCVVTISHSGYVKAQLLSDYRAQKRGGKGKSATAMKDEDFIDQLFVAGSHDTLLCFSSEGKVYWKKVYALPRAGRLSRGKPFVQVLPLEEGERISAVLAVHNYDPDHAIFMATSQGIVKKTALDSFSRQRSSGLIAVALEEGDHLIGVGVTDGSQDVMLLTSDGKSMRFNEQNVRQVGRTARGVRGVNLADDATVISLLLVNKEDEGQILTVTERGYGKRTRVSEFPCKGRGGKGVIAIQTSPRNGNVVGAIYVEDSDDVMLVSDRGILVRTRADGISTSGRNTQGVRLIRLNEQEKLVAIDRIVDEEEEQTDEGESE
jgi:DNA gyrase subunit A